MRKIIKWSIISILLIFTLFIICLIIMPNPIGEPEEFRFTSPSGKTELIVREGCLGHACSHDFHIDSGILPLINRRSCKNLYSGDSIIFSDVDVEWSGDEKIITWKLKSSSKSHTIDINNDCENQLVIFWNYFF